MEEMRPSALVTYEQRSPLARSRGAWPRPWRRPRWPPAAWARFTP